MQIGRMLFYDIDAGSIIVDTGEWSRVAHKKTIDEQIATYNALSERNRESFDVIELDYGQYAQDFAECNGYRVNPETREIEFSYPNPNETDTSEPVYQEPLSLQVSNNAAHLLDVDFRLMLIELGSI